VTDLLSQAKTTVAELLRHASPEERLGLVAFAADPESDQLQAFGDSAVDQANDAEIERFCERVAQRTGGEFVLVVNEQMVVPGLGPMEHLMLAHYSGGTGIGGASARVTESRDRRPRCPSGRTLPPSRSFGHVLDDQRLLYLMPSLERLRRAEKGRVWARSSVHDDS
jgi:hypothetical protein